ncbi:MAG: HlyD family efflux transporter periplasmic adaptor subunit [Suilimivivens sp.]
MSLSNNSNNNIVKYRKPLNINIGMVIFAVILFYIVICIFGYFTSKHVVPYEVKEGSLSTNNIYQGIALRNEEIITADQAGYINYYAREGERVGVGSLVYTLDESGKLAEYIASENSAETTLSAKDLAELKSEILGFVSEFDPEDFSSVYDFKYDVKGTVLKLANANILENIDKINNSGVSELVSFCNAPETGIVIYSMDGYEDYKLEQFTSDLFDSKNYEKTQLISNDLIASGDPVYKLSKDEDWSIVIQVEESKADELEELEYVMVKFLKNQYTSWGQVSRYTNPDGEIFIELTFTNSMITFCTDRFIDIELITEEEKGLKIPQSSIIQKEFFIVPKDYITQGGKYGRDGVMRETYTEDGKATTEFIETTIYNATDTEYYLDDSQLRSGDYIIKPDSTEKYAVSKKGTLVGVYNINKGYADFKQIDVLYENDEYAIVKSNTQYGLNVYDYIALDATSVEDNEIINE